MSVTIDGLWVVKAAAHSPIGDDAAAYDPSPRMAGPCDWLLDQRAVVCDGASASYDAGRWARVLADAFLEDPAEPPDWSDAWFEALVARCRTRWQRCLVGSADVFHAVAAERGAASTLVGVGVVMGAAMDVSAGDAEAVHRWRAVAVGDSVLVHLRDGSELARVPPVPAAGFGISPPLVCSTAPQGALPVWWGEGALGPGDVLLLASDALAEWAVRRQEVAGDGWSRLADIDLDEFDRLVTLARRRGEMVDDDVTLLRVRADFSEQPDRSLHHSTPEPPRR